MHNRIIFTERAVFSDPRNEYGIFVYLLIFAALFSFPDRLLLQHLALQFLLNSEFENIVILALLAGHALLVLDDSESHCLEEEKIKK